MTSGKKLFFFTGVVLGCSVIILSAHSDVIECGTSLEATLENRVSDCSQKLGESANHRVQDRFNWVLVAQNNDGSQIWRDETPIPRWRPDRNRAVPVKVIWTSVSRRQVYYEVARRLCEEDFGMRTLKGNLYLPFDLPTELIGHIYLQHHGPETFPRLNDIRFWGEDEDYRSVSAGRPPSGGILPINPLNNDFTPPIVRQTRHRISLGSDITHIRYREIDKNHRPLSPEYLYEKLFARCVAYEELPAGTMIPEFPE